MNNIFVPRNHRSSGPQRGMSLAEVLVAMTVFVVAAAVALILYNALNQSYKRGDNAADVQQNTRLAFEKLVTDGRMAGFNYNPDGSGARPDEQIEGAWETAITLRGDYDFDDPTDSITPEASLAGGSEIAVSTGNDEIVTYVLAKPDGTSTGSMSFAADVQGVPRDGTVETVTISNIALVHDDPPYTLYRITVNDNSTSVTRTPVADNIYSLRFRYFDSGAAVLGPDPATPLDAGDDIGGVDNTTTLATRESIRRVELAITGMTQDPDMKYTDPDDPYTPSNKHRKFLLTQDVTPRNLGYVGRPDIDLIPPGQPLNLTACAGQCEGVLLQWDAPPSGDLVQQWTVLRGPTASALGTPVNSSTNESFVRGLTEGSSYYFRVRAEDLSGNVSPMSNLAGPVAVGDTTTPSAPTNMEVSGGSGPVPEENDGINVRWTPVTTNLETVSCDPEPTKIRDLDGYQVYRSEAPNAFPGSPYRGPDDGIGPRVSDFRDTDVVACRTYYYNVTAVDACTNASAPLATEHTGSAATEEVPIQGTGLQATPGGSTGVVNLAWDRIAENTAGADMRVDTYRLYRGEGLPAMTPAQALSNIDWSAALVIDAPVSDVTAPAFVDTTALPSDPANSIYYRVAGLTDCSTPFDEGAMSDPNESANCSLGAGILLSPGNGVTVTASTSVSIGVSGADPSDNPIGFVTITDAFGAVVATHGSGSNPNSLPSTFLWSTAALPPGDYVITGTVRNRAGCSESVSHTVSVVPAVPCCIAPQNPVLGPARGAVSQRQSDILFNLVNNCGQDLQVTKMDFSWTNLLGFKRIEHLCYDVDSSTRPDQCLDTALFSLDYVPPSIGPIAQTFTPSLDFPGSRNDLNPLIMGFQYDFTLVDLDNGTGETIGMQVRYLPVGSPDELLCTFQIQTNPLDIVVVDPNNP